LQAIGAMPTNVGNIVGNAEPLLNAFDNQSTPVRCESSITVRHEDLFVSG
jgi:hypothetical protein